MINESLEMKSSILKACLDRHGETLMSMAEAVDVFD